MPNQISPLKTKQLALSGAPAAGGGGANDPERAILDDPELLASVMEAREAVEEAAGPQELRRLLAAARADQAEVERELSAAFKAGDLAAAARLVARLTYHVRLEESIIERL
jgi:molecular chaperone HscB